MGICINVCKVRKTGSSRGENQKGDLHSRRNIDPVSSSQINETTMKLKKTA